MGIVLKILAFPRDFAIWLVAFYQFALSPLKPKCCRFAPTCSEYAKQALQRHGLLKGLALAIWRILRCHPFYHGPMYDPVPDAKDKKSK